MRRWGFGLRAGMACFVLVSCTADSARRADRLAAVASAHEEGEGEDDLEVPGGWFIFQRTFPAARIDPAARLAAFATARVAAGRSPEGGAWRFAGPNNVGGRITDLQSDANDPRRVYIATAAGGVFKSTDGGATMTPI